MLALVLATSSVGRGNEEDFTEHCNKCRCSWKSGKKTADCTNQGLALIPDDLSSELQVLDLSNNVISEIRGHEMMRARQQNLHKLYLRNSTIESLHRDSFRNLTILIELDLSSNKLKRLDPGLFDDLKKLRVIMLNSNQIERIENNLFQNLKFLTKVELNSNQIYRIAQHSFTNVPVLSQIELDFNRLQILRKESFVNLEKLTSLSLTHNPWNCSCALRNFSEFVVTRGLYRSPTTCTQPAHLAGREWSDIKLDDFACRPQIIENRIIYPGDGENATFTCKVTGLPLPQVDWLFHKRPFPKNDKRFSVTKAVRTSSKDATSEVLVSELTIVGVKASDRGPYACKATNPGGIEESEQFFDLKKELPKPSTNKTNDILWIVLFIVLAILVILILTILILCCVCRKARRFKKNSSISENGLMNSKMDKSADGSVLDGGSVIMEMQKSLLTEVNPVEKPPRRADIEASDKDKLDYDEGHEVKKTLLEETGFAAQDEETVSVALSDSTTVPMARSRAAAYIDDPSGGIGGGGTYGTTMAPAGTLPPDLLAFPSTRQFPQSPSIQSSMSNIHDGRIYGGHKSPLSSPIYGVSPGGLVGGGGASGQVPAGFRTLQHPKTGRTIAIAAQRANSPFTAAPLIYPQVVMKQGYVTIPRKPRTPSWTPSMNSTATTAELLPPTSPTSVTSDLLPAQAEPVYDNLGLRTTASGNSTLKLNKSAKAGGSGNYSMKNRPLPATPGGQTASAAAGSANSSSTSNYESIPEVGSGGGQSAMLEAIYGRTAAASAVPGSSSRSKVPPRPPPKPKKKPSNLAMSPGSTMAAASSGNSGMASTSSTSPLFADEGDDGTEV